MRLARIIAAAALLLTIAPVAAAEAQPAAQPVAQAVAQPVAQAAADWTSRVERTPEGGHRMGNPDAPLKLVEYGSITCSHCADFEAEAGAAIREQVRAGRVSFEYRPFPIFPSDPGLFLLLDCQSPDRFFPTVNRLYETQAGWVAKIDAQDARLRQEMERSFPAAMPAIMRAAGTDRLFRENGMTEREIAACLADGAALERLGEAARRAQQLGVRGTPTFFLNDRMLEFDSFGQLVEMLRQP